MPPTIVSDTSCLILFNKINELELLKKVFGRILITEEVAKEFKKDLPDWIEVRKIKSKKDFALRSILDLGEASSISLALEVGKALLIVDELKGRKIAKSLGLDITGSLGVILAAKGKGIITSVKPLIMKIKTTNFRFTDELLKKVALKAGEEF